MFLSIVIPVHNSSRYLPKCLDSIWSQGLPEDDYEVICVDDCSMDDSLAILQKEAAVHPQLRILRNPVNLRAGGARNHGVREAKGEYIQFIDSDDYFHSGSLLRAYEYQKDHQLDILMCDMSRERQGEVNNTPIFGSFRTSVFSGRDFFLVNGLPGGPTKYFFKRDLMTVNAVWFEEKVASEDPDWVLRLPYFAATMQYQPILIHHYVIYPDSSTGAEYKSSKAIFDRVRCGHRIMKLLTLYDKQEERERIFAFASSIYRVGLLYFYAIASQTKAKKKLILDYIPKNYPWKGLIRFAVWLPHSYSLLSTIVSPLFLFALKCKRAIKPRQ